MKYPSTKQEIFDRVWDHFVVQGNPRSVSDDGEDCRYRGRNGTRCAVGIFIDDADYDERMDALGGAFDSLFDLLDHAPELRAFLHTHRVTLTELQRIHDLAPTESHLKIKLVDWARHNDLVVP